jgi:uncharacterized protein (DUF433 family)
VTPHVDQQAVSEISVSYVQVLMALTWSRPMQWKDRITIDPAVVVGKPIIKGTRITVELILDRIADGWSIDEVLVAYPHISREDVLAAILFAADPVQE